MCSPTTTLKFVNILVDCDSGEEGERRIGLDCAVFYVPANTV